MRLTASDVVLVSGGASGLGAATVASVVGAGARAVVLDLPAAGDQVEQGERIRFVGGDVREEPDVLRAVEVAGTSAPCGPRSTAPESQRRVGWLGSAACSRWTTSAG